MPWIYKDDYLTQEEMTNNAQIAYDLFYGSGTEGSTACAIIGNMQSESTLSPALNERGGGGGYGLVQWTPKSNLTDACNILGLSPYTDGDVQCQVILAEIVNTAGVEQWYSSEAFISRYYNSGATSDMVGITGEQFLKNEMEWDAGKLAILFMAAYERPSYDPETNHWQTRRDNANDWFNQLGFTFVPRLNDNGIQGNPWYFDRNPFYNAGFGMPNCTAYAWGRRGEITDVDPDTSLRNADTWWEYNQTNNVYPSGQEPKLGAIMCWSYTGSHSNQGGHVAIVEEILDNGDVNASNSAYGGAFFYMKVYSKSAGYEWTEYTNFQGFIYLKNTPQPPKPPEPPSKKNKMPLWMYLFP